MPFDKAAVEALGIQSVAEVVKECWITTDGFPPLAVHDYVRVLKGSIVGLLDEVDWSSSNDVFAGGWIKVRAYVSDGSRYSLGMLPREALKPPRGGRNG